MKKNETKMIVLLSPYTNTVFTLEKFIKRWHLLVPDDVRPNVLHIIKSSYNKKQLLAWARNNLGLVVL